MKYAHEFRDPVLAQGLLGQIRDAVARTPATVSQPLNIMEVCGGHTHAIFRYGLHEMVPREIEFIHGPGCPVCVLPMGRVDDCIEIAEHPQVIFATFGDAMRVPGTQKSMLQAKAEGADIRLVYSPLDALAIARCNPDREVVFFALGFETTMPSTALTVLQAVKEGIGNFSLFCNHITVPQPIKALLDDPTDEHGLFGGAAARRRGPCADRARPGHAGLRGAGGAGVAQDARYPSNRRADAGRHRARLALSVRI